jgi:hypothetical protein
MPTTPPAILEAIARRRAAEDERKAFVAKHSSTCPICGIYIAKNRSRIQALPEPIYPVLELWTDVDRERAYWYEHRDPNNPRRKPERSYKFVHSRCAPAAREHLGADVGI